MANPLKTKRRQAEKKRPLIIPPLRRPPGCEPGRVAGDDERAIETLVAQIVDVCARRCLHPFDDQLGRLEMRLRYELRGLGFSERELGISPRQLKTNPRSLRAARSPGKRSSCEVGLPQARSGDRDDGTVGLSHSGDGRRPRPGRDCHGAQVGRRSAAARRFGFSARKIRRAKRSARCRASVRRGALRSRRRIEGMRRAWAALDRAAHRVPAQVRSRPRFGNAYCLQRAKSSRSYAAPRKPITSHAKAACSPWPRLQSSSRRSATASSTSNRNSRARPSPVSAEVANQLGNRR